jgi:hypothetical protein
MKKIFFTLLLFISLLSTVYGKIDYSKLEGSLYTEYPLVNGIQAKYDLNSEYFVQLKVGNAPEFYMEQMGDILSNFEWWDDLYSKLLTEILTDMNGFSIIFGKNNVFNDKNCYITFGTSVYELDYITNSNTVIEEVLHIDLSEEVLSNKINIGGRLVAFTLSFGKRFPLKNNWSIDTQLIINKIVSVYIITESEFIINDELSYGLSKWAKENLETLTLPTVSVGITKKF